MRYLCDRCEENEVANEFEYCETCEIKVKNYFQNARKKKNRMQRGKRRLPNKGRFGKPPLNNFRDKEQFFRFHI